MAVKPNNFNSRPVVESLAGQLQRQKISAEGASGYSKFKSEFQRAVRDDDSPIQRPSDFQVKRKNQFASKKALFEQTGGDENNYKPARESLPGSGSVQNARNSLFNQPKQSYSNPVSLVDKPRPSSAEKYRRDIRLQAVDEADFPDPPPPPAQYSRYQPHQSSKPIQTTPPANQSRFQPPTQSQFESEETVEAQASHVYSQPIEAPVRSQSEHRFKESTSAPLTARTNSLPTDLEMYSQITVCMSQVKFYEISKT